MNLLIRVNRYLLRKAIRILNGLLKLSEKLNVDYSMSFASLKS